MVLVLLIIHADRNTVGYLPYAMHRNHRNRRQIMVTKGERVRGGMKDVEKGCLDGTEKLGIIWIVGSPITLREK